MIACAPGGAQVASSRTIREGDLLVFCGASRLAMPHHICCRIVLEQDGIIERTVDAKDVVSDRMTEFGRTLRPALTELAAWGIKHRRRSAEFTGSAT